MIEKDDCLGEGPQPIIGIGQTDLGRGYSAPMQPDSMVSGKFFRAFRSANSQFWFIRSGQYYYFSLFFSCQNSHFGSFTLESAHTFVCLRRLKHFFYNFY